MSAAPPVQDSAATRPAAAAPPAPPAESLPFTVYVASLTRLSDALAQADSLAAHGVPAIVAPIRARGREASFRLLAGPYATVARADSALASLRAAGWLAEAGGTRDSTPLSVALAAGLTRDAALAERARLRQAGVPTFILGQDDGTFGLYAGAYGASAQAAMLTDILTPTGGAGTLVPRSGFVP